MTTRVEIETWFSEGKSLGMAFMVVFCDTYDWTDYPEFFRDEQSAKAETKRPVSMRKVMEIYDLNAPPVEQLNARRSFPTGFA